MDRNDVLFILDVGRRLICLSCASYLGYHIFLRARQGGMVFWGGLVDRSRNPWLFLILICNGLVARLFLAIGVVV